MLLSEQEFTEKINKIQGNKMMQEKNRQNKRGRKADKRNSLRERLSEDLRSGVLTGKLPGLTQLAKQYDACPATVQRTLQELAAVGLVDIRPRSGTYVKQFCDVDFIFFEDYADVSINSGTVPSSFLAEYGTLYNGLYDALQESGVTCRFHQIGKISPQFLAGKTRVVALFSQYIEDFGYKFLESTNWIRVMGAQDYNCPGGHITYDNSQIGKVAVNFLRSGGCSGIACLGSPKMLLFRQRIDSVRDECAVQGIEMSLWEVDLHTMPLAEICQRIRSLIAANREALQSGELGIFCCADHFMVPLRQEMAAAGLSPAQVRHLSCDNNRFYLQGIYPPSVEIDIGMYRIGAAAARQILGPVSQINDKSAIAPELVLPEEK